MKQKAYETLAFSELLKKTTDHLVNSPWRAIFQYYEKVMRTTSRGHALIAVPDIRTELHSRPT